MSFRKALTFWFKSCMVPLMQNEWWFIKKIELKWKNTIDSSNLGNIASSLDGIWIVSQALIVLRAFNPAWCSTHCYNVSFVVQPNETWKIVLISSFCVWYKTASTTTGSLRVWKVTWREKLNQQYVPPFKIESTLTSRWVK